MTGAGRSAGAPDPDLQFGAKCQPEGI